MSLPPSMVDPDATPATRKLFARLRAAANSGVSLIGMDASTRYGQFLCPDPAGPKDWSLAAAGDRTDIGDVCGRHPSIYGMDTSDIVGDWIGRGQSDEERARQRAESRALSKAHIKKVHARGGVITLHYHMNNPIDDQPFNSPPSELWQLVVPSECTDGALPENAGAAFDKFREKIDSLVDFLEELKDENGNLIPVIFRPFHENNGSWFWWCPKSYEEEDVEIYTIAFRRIWKWMVWYIRDYRNFHALLWATSPNGGLGDDGLTTPEAYWKFLPDPAFVDVLGYDRYTDYATTGALPEVRVVVEEAERLGKIAAVTEAGFSFKGDDTLWPENVWTKGIIGPIKDDDVARRVAWILLWHNFPNDDDESGQFFGPHINHSSAPDFVRVSKRDDVLFEDDLLTTNLITEEEEED